MTMTPSEIPSLLLLDFFQKARHALESYESKQCVCSLSIHRNALLQVQLECLSQVVAKYNDVTVKQVQQVLKDLGSSPNINNDVKEAMNQMNDAARLAFCRLVLRDEYMWDASASQQTLERKLNRGETNMTRADLVEYAGLCNGVVRLANVQKHLKDGSRLFDDVEQTSPMFPSNRLERIQQVLLRAVGYDIEFGKKEIERFYFHNASQLDEELIQILNNLSSNMTNAISTEADCGTTEELSDQNQGGVTRVVSVTYSEKILSPDGQQVSSTTSAPAIETIQEHDEEEQLSQLKMARQAASLEQAILNDLMNMSEPRRQEKLALARQIHNDFLREAMEIPPGPDRIAFLTSVDPDQQQLLLIHKLWTKRMQEHDGKVSATM